MILRDVAIHRRGGVNNDRCSGRGRCDCVCICEQREDPNEIIFGEACECDNFRCDADDEGRVCSGEYMCVGIHAALVSSHVVRSSP